MINSLADSLARSAVRYTQFGGQSYCCPSWAGQKCVPLGGDYDLLGPFPGRTASGHGTDCELWIYKLVKTLISYHRQVLKGWMISRKVLTAPKPRDQPFQLTPVRRGAVSPPRGGRIQEGSDGRHFSYPLQLSRLNSFARLKFVL